MRSRSIRFLALALLLIGGTQLVGVPKAGACSCAMISPHASLAEADAAFVGALVDREEQAGPMFDSAELVDFTFEVETVVKGEIPDPIVVKSAASGASCGFETAVGERVGILLSRVEGSEWHGGLCSTLDADLLLEAAEGLPEPIQGSPPHLIVSSQLGEVGIVALDRAGQVVGYGQGPSPWLLSACPDGVTFIGSVSNNRVLVWSFTDLAIVGEAVIGNEGSGWLRNLACVGPEGNTILAVTEQGSLVRHHDGQSELLLEDAQALVETSRGLLVLTGDGALLGVDRETGTTTELMTGLGRLRNQVGAVVPSPSGAHLAISTVDWNASPVQGRVVVVDLANQSHAELTFACDIYPNWIDDASLLLWDTCNQMSPDVYNTSLELVGAGRQPVWGGYSWTVRDETGTVFFPAELGMQVVESGADKADPFGPVLGYPNAALLVPAEAQTAWTGSELVPPPITRVVSHPPEPGEPQAQPVQTLHPLVAIALLVLVIVAVSAAIWFSLRCPQSRS